MLHRVYTVLRDIDGNTNGIFHGLGLDDDEHLYGNNKVVAIGTSSYSTNKNDNDSFDIDQDNSNFMEMVALGQTSWNSVLQAIENGDEKEKT